MQVPSNLLAVFSKHDGVLRLDDASLEVPSTLVPVVEIPGIVGRMTLGGFNTQDNASVFESVTDTVTNGSVDAYIAILAAGLWDIEIAATFAAGYTDLTEANQIYMLLEPPAAAGSQMNFPKFFCAANVPQHQRHHFRIASIVPFSFSRVLSANGVGETKIFEMSLIANRLA